MFQRSETCPFAVQVPEDEIEPSSKGSVTACSWSNSLRTGALEISSCSPPVSRVVLKRWSLDTRRWHHSLRQDGF